jgi:hypothetical protein
VETGGEKNEDDGDRQVRFYLWVGEVDGYWCTGIPPAEARCVHGLYQGAAGAGPTFSKHSDAALSAGGHNFQPFMSTKSCPWVAKACDCAEQFRSATPPSASSITRASSVLQAVHGSEGAERGFLPAPCAASTYPAGPIARMRTLAPYTPARIRALLVPSQGRGY